MNTITRKVNSLQMIGSCQMPHPKAKKKLSKRTAFFIYNLCLLIKKQSIQEDLQFLKNIHIHYHTKKQL